MPQLRRKRSIHHVAETVDNNNNNNTPKKKQKRNNDLKFDIDFGVLTGVNSFDCITKDQSTYIPFDEHIKIQINPKINDGIPVIQWKNKAVLPEETYHKISKLIESKYFHFDPMSVEEITELRELVPKSLAESVCVTKILYHIHKSVIARLSIRNHNDPDILNHTRNDLQRLKINKLKKLKEGKISEYSNNVFHKVAKKRRIAPTFLAIQYLNVAQGIKFREAQEIIERFRGRYGYHVCREYDFETELKQMKNRRKVIKKEYQKDIPVPVLQSIYHATISDFIEGTNPEYLVPNWIKSVGLEEESKNGKSSSWFENCLVEKLRPIIEKLNGKMLLESDKITMLTEDDRRKKFDCNHCITTPDLWFDKPIVINGSLINWIDAKNLFFVLKEPLEELDVYKQIKKYTEEFGKGAIVSLGFVPVDEEKLDVLLLEGSQWLEVGYKNIEK